MYNDRTTLDRLPGVQRLLKLDSNSGCKQRKIQTQTFCGCRELHKSGLTVSVSLIIAEGQIP